MKNIVLLLILFLCPIIAQKKDSLLFPFDVHNKWYYSTYHNSLITREIVEQNGNQYKVSVYPQFWTKFEFWKIENGCLVISDNIIPTGSFPTYISDRNTDTTFIDIGSSPYTTKCSLKVISDSLWGNGLKQEFSYSYVDGHNRIEWSDIRTTPGVGMYSIHYSSTISGNGGYLELIGMFLNGVLIGDSTITGINDDLLTSRFDYELKQNYPNPFNPTTIINYSVTKQSVVKLTIYDALGREVATLVNEEKSAGNYTTEFNAANLSSGIYFYQIRAGDFVQTKKMILLR